MIVCSCNVITRRDIEVVIEELYGQDAYAVVTPNLIYHRMSKRGRCCGCFPQVVRILIEHGTLVRERLARGEAVRPANDVAGALRAVDAEAV
jgi:hypothetical protein